MSAVHESPNRVSIADLYAVGRQHDDGSLTIPWEALERWAEDPGADDLLTSDEAAS